MDVVFLSSGMLYTVKYMYSRHDCVLCITSLHPLNRAVDPCLVNNGGCDHFCAKGRCDCLLGFSLDSDGKTCNGMLE